jgi:hypothetical protein
MMRTGTPVEELVDLKSQRNPIRAARRALPLVQGWFAANLRRTRTCRGILQRATFTDEVEEQEFSGDPLVTKEAQTRDPVAQLILGLHPCFRTDVDPQPDRVCSNAIGFWVRPSGRPKQLRINRLRCVRPTRSTLGCIPLLELAHRQVRLHLLLQPAGAIPSVCPPAS